MRRVKRQECCSVCHKRGSHRLSQSTTHDSNPPKGRGHALQDLRPCLCASAVLQLLFSAR
eukprot:scaffold1220_cov259-Pinguiococcus_pyrenoidosus.AAC.152